MSSKSSPKLCFVPCEYVHIDYPEVGPGNGKHSKMVEIFRYVFPVLCMRETKQCRTRGLILTTE